MIVKYVDECKDNPHSNSDVDDGENFTSHCLRRKITKSYGGKRNERKIEGIQIVPAFQVMINNRPKEKNDDHRE